MDPRETLERFALRHQRCSGDPRMVEPTDTDFTPAGTAFVSVTCPGCGDSVRVEYDFMAAVREIAQQSGIGEEEFEALSATEAGIEQLRVRIQASAGFMPMLLARRRRIEGRGSSN